MKFLIKSSIKCSKGKRKETRGQANKEMRAGRQAKRSGRNGQFWRIEEEKRLESIRVYLVKILHKVVRATCTKI